MASTPPDSATIGTMMHLGEFTAIERIADATNGRFIARKTARAGLSRVQADFVRIRLRAEAAIRTELRGPGILPLLHMTDDDRGIALDGPWLPATLASSNDPLHSPLRLLRPLAATIDQLHRHGWCNLDVAPSNVLLDDWGRPVLGDFGTACRPGETLLDGSVTPLTPAFAAPEQWRMDPADPATDIYALAVIAFWSLTGGRTPFDQSAIDDLRDAHLSTERPTLPSDLASAAALQPIFDEALAVDASIRPTTAIELVNRLEAALDRREPLAPTASTPTVMASLGARLDGFAETLTDAERIALAALLAGAERHTNRLRGRFERLVMSLVAPAQIVAAAEAVGIIDELATGPIDIAELERRCRVPKARLEPVLALLVAENWAVETRDGHRLTDIAAVAIGSNGSNGHVSGSIGVWSKTVDWLEQGVPVLDMTDDQGAAYSRAVAALANTTQPLADDLAEHLGATNPPPVGAAIIDIGCGAAPWSRALLLTNPTATVDLVDRPLVIEACARELDRLGLAGRAETVAHDWREIGSTATHDLAVLGNVCHCFDGDDAGELIRRAGSTLRPGGVLVVIDTLRTSRWTRAQSITAVHLGLRTGAGTLHAESDYRGWIADAGLVPFGQFDFPRRETPLRAIFARRANAH